MLSILDGVPGEAYLAAAVLIPIIGIIPGLLSGKGARSASVAMCAIGCVLGILILPLHALGMEMTAEFPLPSFWGRYTISFGTLESVFASISSIVFLMTVLHQRHSGSVFAERYPAMLCALYAACLLCIGSGTSILLLVSWEAVSMVTFLMADNGDDETPRWRFFTVTHMGGMMIIGAFAYMWYVAGTSDLSQWNGLWESMGPVGSSAVILLLFIGFGTKLGTIPFHAWMPDMYGKSPTHTTVLLTTVCSNVAVLILFKSVLVFVGADGCGQPVALGLCVISAITALWGALLSLIQTDTKRILSYSSMENMGLVTMFLALTVFFHKDVPALAAVSLIAALFHTLNHSVFKALMLMSVDTVEGCTGERSIDRYGGIAKTLPVLSSLALIGVMTMSSIPPMSSFASEWMMLQSLLGTDAIDTAFRVVMPLLIALMGLCGMVVATSYARMYGFIFLGRPRSEGAANPKTPGRLSLGSMAVLAAMCIGMGLAAFPIMDSLEAGASSLIGIDLDYRSGLSGNMDPLVIGLTVVGTAALIYGITRIFSKRTREEDTWGCGGDLDERMQYSSEGFSQPIVRVFHPVLGDRSTLSSGRLYTEFTEPFVKYIYKPVGDAFSYVSVKVRLLQTGNIQHYLGYILIALVAVLLAVRLSC
jgi:formate hydrogenlyase subunit 3/multisubunit Na+/H+ antiporter MnhD subunit